MNVLAVNSSGFSASMAIGKNASTADESWHVDQLEESQKTAQHLIPSIKSLLDSQNLGLGDIDVFAVTSGPGSFTGLRIGMTTLKSFAYATGSKIVGVNSLAVIAQNAIRSGAWSDGNLTVAMNAFRKQLFVATFEWNKFNDQSALGDSITQVISESELSDRVEQQGSMLVTSGVNPDSPCLEKISKESIVGDNLNNSAVGVGVVGMRMLKGGNDTDAIGLLPNYFRGSAAEEKLRNGS